MTKKHQKKCKSQQPETKKEKFIRIISVSSIFLPCIVYFLFTLWLFPARDSYFHVLGFCSAFLLGLALFFLIGSAAPAVFGFQFPFTGYVALAVGGLGSVLMLLTCLLLYVPKVYQNINEEAVHRYFLLLSLLLLSGLSYWFFRMNVKVCLRIRGYSKSAIRKRLQGKKMWWYQEFRSEIGLLYPINLVLTISLSVASVLLVALGWLASARPLIEWLVAFNLIGLGIALIVSGFYSQFKLLEKQTKSDRSLIFGYFVFAGFLVYCAIKTVSK